MAGGNGSARQKMINLMYLVFIAMLAMNMGKQVLSSFGYLNEKLENSNITASQSIEAVLSNLSLKASEQPEKYKDINDKAVKISNLSSEFFTYLQGVKDTLLASVKPELHKDYESLDSDSAINEMFFAGEKKLTPAGDKFVASINEYRDNVNSIVGEGFDAGVLNNLSNRFNTSDQVLKSGLTQPWIRNRYAGFPLVAALTNISVIQSDIKASEKEIYAALSGNQLSADAGISANTYRTIVLTERPVYFAGDPVVADIVLGRVDASLVPDKVIVNGREVNGRENGKAVLKISAGSVGEHKLKGSFIFKQNGEDVEIPIESTYLVIPKPNSAVVSADKMNVVYRGVENPITISIPGVSDNNVNASAIGLSKIAGIGKYILKPGKGKEVVINVTGKTSDGTVINSPPVTFRIKDIPPPAATIRKKFGTIKLPKSSLSKSTVEARLIDFDFDLKLKVSSFKLKIPGQATVLVKGKRFDSRAQKALAKSKRGDIISVFDVKASIIGNSSYRLKGVMPLSIEVTN